MLERNRAAETKSNSPKHDLETLGSDWSAINAMADTSQVLVSAKSLDIQPFAFPQFHLYLQMVFAFVRFLPKEPKSKIQHWN